MDSIEFPRISTINLRRGDQYFWTQHKKEGIPEVLIKREEGVYESHYQGILTEELNLQVKRIVSPFTMYAVLEEVGEDWLTI